MPSYKAVLTDKTEIRITADDVNIDSPYDGDDACPDQGLFFNFTKNNGDEDSTTVAAIPFNSVLYITS